MASVDEIGKLSDAEYTDLEERVDRFHAAWRADSTIDMVPFLPPPGSRHRLFVLVEMIKTDMERRAQAGLSVRVETYLGRFHTELQPETMPVSLLAEEYRLRHQYADKPRLEEYRHRFPTLAEGLAAHLKRVEAAVDALKGQRKDPANPPSPPSPARTIGFEASTPSETPVGSGPSSRLADALPRTRSQVPRSGGSRRSLSGSRPDVLPADLEYRLLRRLGAGAFGEVYEAEAPGGIRVAVKRILRSVDHPVTQREIEALEAIKTMGHPFLVQTQAYWVFEDRLVIVMELADGSLADRVKFHQDRGLPGVPPEELIPFFEQAADALDYLHAMKVSHRDIKPENLLHLKGYAKVADFGLAREHHQDLTKVSMDAGTPLYMPPEVWNHELSLQSDQYSFAVTYVAARLGRPLFPAKRMIEIAQHHAEVIPNLDPLPPDEQRVLLRALAKKPEDRFPSCKEFTRALWDVVLKPPAPRAVRYSRRALLVIGVSAFLAVGLAVIVGPRLFPTPVPPVPVSVPPALPPAAPVAVVPLPQGWVPVDATRTRTLPDGRVYYQQITRQVPDTDVSLVANLIPPKNADELRPFYLLRDKVTNRVFDAVWKRAAADPTSRISRFAPNENLVRGDWRKGAKDVTGRALGIEGTQADVPVVGVTAVEAMLVAEELGGRLPTYQEWLQAVGIADDGTGPGPAGPAEKPDEDYAARNLALNRKNGPAPITTPTADVSATGIHQLVTNGCEWTCVDGEDKRITLNEDPSTTPFLRVTGQNWVDKTILTFARIRNDRQLYAWNETNEMLGFRLVLVPGR